ncbi:MAG: cytidylate kinase-like family protein [Spirochaetaceae bacterium]|jgi:cytidylate kinase|nr:cytidylate kinase-like family protein [Spirochaetaceae bacterium]
MSIITISRELAALGDETARELAKLLQYRFIDKGTLEGRIKSYGVTGAQIDKYDERKPGVFAALSQDRDMYLHFLKSAMLAEAGEGNCIFIGRGANAIFRGLAGLVSVFLTAPAEVRQERIKSYFHCDDKKARHIINQSDRDRQGFHSNLFELDWRSPANYHLTLNTGYYSPAVSAEIVRDLLEKTVTADAGGEQKKSLAELTLGHNIVTHIFYGKNINIHFLEAQVSETKIELFGVANSSALVEAAVAAAKEAAGSLRVVSEIQVVQEYNILS